MPFRMKLLIVLLCLSLLPILFMRINGMGAMKKLISRYVPQAREYAMNAHEEKLQNVAEHYSYATELGGGQIQLILYLQAQAIQKALAGSPPSTDSPLFTIMQGEDNPEFQRTTFNVTHYRLTRQGIQKNLPVSFAQQDLDFLSERPVPSILRNLNQLRELDPFFERLSFFSRNLMLWQFTCLENGLISVYPAVGQKPAYWDPRKSYWYRRVKETRRVQWTLAHIDPISKRSVISLAMPLKGPDGSFVGVTSVQVPISIMLEKRQITDQVPPNTKVIMASHEPCCGKMPPDSQVPEDADKEVLIIAKPEYDDKKRRHWRHPVKPEFLTSLHTIPLKAMLMDLRAGRSGSQRMEFEGKDSLWAYAPMDGPAFLVLITPYEEILAPVSRVEHEVMGNVSNLMNMITFLGLGVMIVVVVVAVIFSRTVTKPLLALASASRRLGEGDFDARVKVKSRDEVGQIGKAFNALGPRLRENYQLRQALALAMEVQQRLLPQSQPETQGLDVFGKSVYCDETGGDYYDFIVGPSQENDGLYVVVGDVSGHGLPAALLMASARAFLRQRISMVGELGQILEDVNRQLVLDVYQTGRFMTLLACRFQEAGRVMSWARAGHDPPLIYDPLKDTFEEPSDGGLPLGVMDDTEFPQCQCRLEPGQIVFLGTDGIWETHNPSGEFYGKERVRECIRRNRDKSSADIVHTVINELNSFRGDNERDDDITLIAVKVLG